jgi:peptide/nickel transport system substrate-binding protein
MGSGLNASRFANQKLDVYLLTARRIADNKARTTLYNESESIIREEAPVIPLNHSIHRIAAAPGVKGAELSGFGLLDLHALAKN